MNEYYKSNFEEALVYQDYVSDMLRIHYGIFLGLYGSRKYQFDKGESASGIEIKHDKKYAEKGNLFIEVAEKTNPRNQEYIPSGIMRDDNCWLYLIGNYDEAFLFSKRQLQEICSDSKREYRRKHGIWRYEATCDTKIGYVFPGAYIKTSSILLKHFEFKKAG